MVVTSPKVMCTGKPEPRAWEFNGRSGVSYKVNISDGSSNLELPVKDAEIWNICDLFKPVRFLKKSIACISCSRSPIETCLILFI